MGLTLLAAGTSIPDTVASVMVAREGMFNSHNLFDLNQENTFFPSVIIKLKSKQWPEKASLL